MSAFCLPIRLMVHRYSFGWHPEHWTWTSMAGNCTSAIDLVIGLTATAPSAEALVKSLCQRSLIRIPSLCLCEKICTFQQRDTHLPENSEPTSMTFLFLPPVEARAGFLDFSTEDSFRLSMFFLPGVILRKLSIGDFEPTAWCIRNEWKSKLPLPGGRCNVDWHTTALLLNLIDLCIQYVCT